LATPLPSAIPPSREWHPWRSAP